VESRKDPWTWTLHVLPSASPANQHVSTWFDILFIFSHPFHPFGSSHQSLGYRRPWPEYEVNPVNHEPRAYRRQRAGEVLMSVPRALTARRSVLDQPFITDQVDALLRWTYPCT